MEKHKKPRSKKLIKGDYELEFPSSVHAVVSNDDLLMEILLRLPVISLHVFKLVSKWWLSLIAATNITLGQCQISKIDPPTGFFLWRPKRTFVNGIPSVSQQGFKYDFVSFDTVVPSKRSTTITMGSRAPYVDFHILQSCNGLLLLGCDHNDWYPRKFYICNPFLKLFKTLPRCDDLKLDVSSNATGMILAFDPTRSPHYKVIKTALEYIYDDGPDHFVQIIIYSSETDKWYVCGDRFSDESFNCFEDGIYWNDAIHWINYNRSFNCLHFKLEIQDVHHPVLTTIPTPVTSGTQVQFGHKLFSSRDCLLFLCEVNRDFNAYQMINENAGWSLKYVVNIHDITKPFPKTHRIGPSSVSFLVLGERDEDSFMVIEIHSQVVQYKIVLKTVRELCESEWKSAKLPFIASLAGV